MTDFEQVPTIDSAAPTQIPEANELAVPEVSAEKWQALTSRWNAIVGVEATIETLRITLEGQRSELEGMCKQTLGVEDRMTALQNDVAQWNKAKSRVHYALPRVREFIHRANLAACVPERKRLDELTKQHLVPRVPFPGADKVLAEMEHLLKDRQALLAQGNAVSQECRGIAAEIQRALSTLRTNAANNARRKRAAGR